MATRFEVALSGGEPASLRAAGEEALDEISRVESRLSLYRGDSEIAAINRHAGRQPVRVSQEVFNLLRQAARLSAETGGAFDPTIAPLMRCWGFMTSTGSRPTNEQLETARSLTGMSRVILSEDDLTVRFEQEGMMLDLGAIGKGYAIERAMEFLREAGMTSALLHGGTSTVAALGSQPDGSPWRVALEEPHDAPDAIPDPNRPQGVLGVVDLQNESLSVSAIWGRAFRAEATTYGHVIDPHTGQPVRTALLAAVVTPSATESDALSTALLVRGFSALEHLLAQRANLRAYLWKGPGNELQSKNQTRSEG